MARFRYGPVWSSDGLSSAVLVAICASIVRDASHVVFMFILRPINPFIYTRHVHL